MFSTTLTRVFGSRNQRLLKRLDKTVAEINALEEGLIALGDDALATKTTKLKVRLRDGDSIDGILPEAFAVVREVSRRTLDMRHFDVQLVGGMVLYDGRIAEMRMVAVGGRDRPRMGGGTGTKKRPQSGQRVAKQSSAFRFVRHAV